MKVTEHIARANNNTLISFEILPPLKGDGIQAIYNVLDPLMEFKPPFINVTYHRSEYIFKRNREGLFEKVNIRKRPGTVGICAAIMNRYTVDAVPHIICGGFKVEETEDALIDLAFLGIDNALVLRGDPTKNESQFMSEAGGHKHAIELVRQIINMNNGKYLDEELENGVHTDFCIGVAGYPEKHYEAPNMQTDLKYLKEKINAGSEYIVTQMFFDNKKFFEYVTRCREIGITVPIIPGLKPITTKKQLTILPRTFQIDIPVELASEIEKCKNDDEVKKVGVEWTTAQCKELVAKKVPVLHFYTMSNVVSIKAIVSQLF
jgi:methylenetetrahydrofolate reductase (NADPH)